MVPLRLEFKNELGAGELTHWAREWVLDMQEAWGLSPAPCGLQNTEPGVALRHPWCDF